MLIKFTLLTVLMAVFPSLGSAGGDIKRGEYLVEGPMGCGNCHTPMGPEGVIKEQNLGGRLVEDIDAFTAYAPNITPYGRVSKWSDSELQVAIREGLRPDGTVIGAPMPFPSYRHISDFDLEAIVAYLRTVPDVENSVPSSEYRIPLPPAYGPEIGKIEKIDPAVSVEYGEYVAMTAHCMECHSPMTPLGPDWENSLGKGGFEFQGPWGISVSSNLTNHEDGLANYTDEEVKRMITQGIRPDGSNMFPPMPYGYLAKMTETDLDALLLYLRNLPAL